jgi:hypothetical protein
MLMELFSSDQPMEQLALRSQEARRFVTVWEVTIARRPGEEVQPAAEATHRLGHVITTSGPDPGRVIAEADAALACLEPVLEPAAPAGGEVA